MRKICEVWESDTGETVFKFDAFYCDDKVIEMLSRIEADSKKVKLIVKEGKHLNNKHNRISLDLLENYFKWLKDCERRK